MQYEIDKLNSNYSAASDVGRYTILYREGGMYLDPCLKLETGWGQPVRSAQIHKR